MMYSRILPTVTLYALGKTVVKGQVSVCVCAFQSVPFVIASHPQSRQTL